MFIEKYPIIYADPPWRYSAKKVQGAAENHYPTMSIDELCALPVAELAAKDSALFMWATFPQLPEALRLIRAWGFTYKSVAFVWLKKNRKADSWFYGLGFWTRANAEVCLLATKGQDVYKRQGKGFADRGLFLPVQLLCGKLLKRCDHNVRVPAFEKHKVTGLFALNLFQRKIYVVLLRGTLKGFDIAVGDLDVGNTRILLHKLPHGLFPCLLYTSHVLSSGILVRF